MRSQEIAHKVEFRGFLLILCEPSRFFLCNYFYSSENFENTLSECIVQGRRWHYLLKVEWISPEKTLSQTVWPQLYSPVLTAAKSVLVVLVHRSVFPDPLTGAVSLAGDVPFDVRFRNFGVQLHWKASTSVWDYYFSLPPCHALYPFNSLLHPLSHSVS